MKAIRIHAFGGPDRVKLEEVPIPRLTRGKVLVRVRAAAVNPVDWMVREQIYNPEGADTVPLTLGQDFAGVVERLGPGTTGLREGERVFGELWGAFAEYAVAPVHDLVKLPAALDFVTAASIPMPALTAWQVIVDAAKARPGMRILVHGASGGVGSFAVQFARLKGASVAATASPASFPFLRSVGVEELIDYHRQRFEDRVREVDVVVDPIGGEVQRRSLRVLRKGGVLINLLGEANEAAARKAGVRAIDFGMEYDTAQLAEIARLVASGEVRAHITRLMPLAKARQALNLNQQGRSHGKIVLQVPSPEL